MDELWKTFNEWKEENGFTIKRRSCSSQLVVVIKASASDGARRAPGRPPVNIPHFHRNHLDKRALESSWSKSAEWPKGHALIVHLGLLTTRWITEIPSERRSDLCEVCEPRAQSPLCYLQYVSKWFWELLNRSTWMCIWPIRNDDCLCRSNMSFNLVRHARQGTVIWHMQHHMLHESPSEMIAVWFPYELSSMSCKPVVTRDRE